MVDPSTRIIADQRLLAGRRSILLSPRPTRAPYLSEPSSPTLDEALRRQGLQLEPARIKQLDAYCQLLWEWNGRLNLTRHTTYDLFVARDVIDALQLARFVQAGEEVLDIGSGGGAPAVPLAILHPEIDISLCESVAKKAKALDDIVRRLELSLPVHHARAEALLEDLSYDTLIARAVGPLSKLCQLLAPHWMSFRRVVLVKGPKWIEERADARHRGLLSDLELRKLSEYQSPGLDGQCVILQLTRRGAP